MKLRPTTFTILFTMISFAACSSGPADPATDTGTPDMITPDAGVPDLGTPDAGTPDVATPDGGSPDVGTADAETPDTQQTDTSSPDALPDDAGPAINCEELDCDDNNPCTDDSCEPVAGCQTTFNTGDCDDDDACTIGDVCDMGSCQSGDALTCTASDACSIYPCDDELPFCLATPQAEGLTQNVQENFDINAVYAPGFVFSQKDLSFTICVGDQVGNDDGHLFQRSVDSTKLVTFAQSESAVVHTAPNQLEVSVTLNNIEIPVDVMAEQIACLGAGFDGFLPVTLNMEGTLGFEALTVVVTYLWEQDATTGIWSLTKQSEVTSQTGPSLVIDCGLYAGICTDTAEVVYGIVEGGVGEAVRDFVSSQLDQELGKGACLEDTLCAANRCGNEGCQASSSGCSP